MLVNKDAYQRETLTKWPIRLPLTPQNSFFSIKIVANRRLKVSENTHVAALLCHLVYHHFRVYDNVSRLFSIDFFLKND